MVLKKSHIKKNCFKKEIKNIKEEDIIDTLDIGKFYDFYKFNIKYGKMRII